MKKNITMTSISEEDRRDLFKLICDKIVFKTPIQVMREVTNLPFHHSAAKNYIPTISELFMTLAKYNILYNFELKLTYVEVPKPKKPRVPTEMERQKNEITNPELKEVIKHKVIEYKDLKRKPIDFSKLPNIDI